MRGVPDADQAAPAPHRPLGFAAVIKRVDAVLQNTLVPNLRHLRDEERADLRTLLDFYRTMIDKEEEAAHAG